jgi:predicted Holliday junction resolvase-like endonuclease
MDEWEDSGDWFVERFNDLVKRMKDARQAKRKLAMEFEEEIANREEAVRKSKESVELELRTMKKGGEEVLKSKVS